MAKGHTIEVTVAVTASGGTTVEDETTLAG